MKSSEIVDILKDEGLSIAEDAALTATKAAIALLKKILPQVSTGFGFAFEMFLSRYEKKIYELVDKLDGKTDL